jgi:exosome complex component RRP4
LPYGVDLIIGLNGYIWVSKTVKKELRRDGEEAGFGEESGEGVYSGENEVSLIVSLLSSHCSVLTR